MSTKTVTRIVLGLVVTLGVFIVMSFSDLMSEKKNEIQQQNSASSSSSNSGGETTFQSEMEKLDAERRALYYSKLIQQQQKAAASTSTIAPATPVTTSSSENSLTASGVQVVGGVESSSSPEPTSTTPTRPPGLTRNGKPIKKDNYKASQRELDLIEKLKVEVAQKKQQELEANKDNKEYMEELALDEKYGVNQNWLDDPAQTTETTVEERATKLPMALSLRQFSHVEDFEPLKKPGTEMQCTIAIMATRNCKIWTETLVSCIYRIGKENFKHILPDRCIKSDFWKGEDLDRYLEEYEKKNGGIEFPTSSFMKNYNKSDPDAWKQLNRGPIWDSGIRDTKDRYEPNPYIPPEQRTSAVFPPPRKCSQCEAYPIGFGIPLSRYEKKVHRTKAFDWAPIRPLFTPSNRKFEAKIEEEDFFHELYVQSFFGFNHLRGGFDSMRIWEQLASGIIPTYYDLEKVPINTIGHFPRELVYRAMHLPGVEHVRSEPEKYVRGPHPFGGVNFIANGDIERSGDPKKPIFDLEKYYELADLILEWGRKYCTTRAVASYLLEKLNAQNARKILIFGRTDYDYQEITLTHGFHDLGLEVTVLNTKPGMDILLSRYAPGKKMKRKERDDWIRGFAGIDASGKGFGYSSKMNDMNMKFPWKTNSNQVSDDLAAGKFDVVLFQLDGRHRGYVKTAKDAGAKVGFIQFRDKHGDPDHDTRWACSTGAGPIFIREMNDHVRC